MSHRIFSFLTQMQNLGGRLRDKSYQIFSGNGFKGTSETLALDEMGGDVAVAIRELTIASRSVEIARNSLNNPLPGDPDPEFLKKRLAQAEAEADKIVRRYMRVLNAATALLSSTKIPTNPKEKPKPEPKKEPPPKKAVPANPVSKPEPVGPKGPTTYNDILEKIRKSVSKFNRNIPAAQRAMFDAIEEELKRLDTYSDGKVRTTAKNLSILASIKNKMLRVIVTPEYRAEVKAFAKSFNELTTLQNEYWQQQETKFTPRPVLKALRKQAVSDTVNKLMESGIGVNVGDRVTSIIKTSITTGGSYKALTSQLRDGLLNTEQKGYLDRYAKQVTVDSINQFNSQYTKIVSSDLGYTFFKYDNTLIETSRPFCQAMREENQYFHVSQIPKLLSADDLYYDDNGARKKVPINPKTKLPDGMIPGTNADNFFVNRGGYQCQHSIRPVNERQVPADILAKIKATPEYQRYIAITKPATPNKPR